MNNRNVGFYFFIAVLLVVFVATFFIFKPFIYPMILAAVFVTIFGPVHNKISKLVFRRRGIAAFLSTIIVLLVVIIPVSFLSFQVLQEVSALYSYYSTNQSTTDVIGSINHSIENLIEMSPIDINVVPDINSYLTQGLDWLVGHLGRIFLNVSTILMDVFIFLVALYYLFRDGHRLKQAIVVFSPLKDNHDEAIFSKLAVAVKSIVGGSIVVAIVQGLLTGLGFMIFGVPNPVLWGSVAAIAALVPTLGTSLVIVPAIIYLLFTGQILYAFGLLIWGMTAVGLIDNYLGPKLVGRGIDTHPLLILLSVIGGIALFGPLGFILGPLVLSLLNALLDIYSTIQKENGVY